MGLWARLGRLIRGFFGLFVSGLEESNPKAMLEDVRNQLSEAKVRYHSTTVNILAREKVAAKKLQEAKNKLVECQRLIQEAKKSNDRELALQLLIEEENLTSTLNVTQQAYDAIKLEADNAKKEFTNFEAEMQQKISQIEQLKVQSDLADLKKEMNSLKSNYVTEGGAGKINDSLKQAEDIIHSRLAKEDAVSELGKNSIDTKMRDLKSSVAKSRAEEKLAALFGDNTNSTEEGRVIKEKVNN